MKFVACHIALITIEFMEDLKLLSLADLFDLLIDQTRYHTYLIGMGAGPEQFRLSREILSKLQSEIKLRKSELRSDQTSSPSQHEPNSSGAAR